MQWEEELCCLPKGLKVLLARSTSSQMASEQAYGAVAYLRTVDPTGQTFLSFLIVRSRVTPKRVHSIPRLKLCGSLVAAQLAKLLADELTLPIHSTVLWTDSTTGPSVAEVRVLPLPSLCWQ